MAESLTPQRAPYTAQELLDCGWVERVRFAVLNDGHAVRLGAGPSIQAQVINSPDDWRDIMLPHDGVIASVEDAVAVLAWLDGTQPIPPHSPSDSAQ